MLDDEPAGAEKRKYQLNDYFNSSTKVRIFIHIPHIFNVKRVKKDIYICVQEILILNISVTSWRNSHSIYIQESLAC